MGWIRMRTSEINEASNAFDFVILFFISKSWTKNYRKFTSQRKLDNNMLTLRGGRY
jgi:hypothetical protein